MRQTSDGTLWLITPTIWSALRWTVLSTKVRALWPAGQSHLYRKCVGTRIRSNVMNGVGATRGCSKIHQKLKERFMAYREELERVEVLKYLGHLISFNDNDTQVVRSNLMKA